MKKNIYIIITLLSFIISKDLDGIGYVSFIDGNCYVENIVLDRQSYPLLGNLIFNHDIISSVDNSTCEILFNDNSSLIKLDSNTKIKIYIDDFSKTITLINGSLYGKTAKIDEKFYIKTIHNDIYLNDNAVWVSTSINEDEIISLKSNLDIFNNYKKSRIQLVQFIGYKINRTGKVLDDGTSEFPKYILENKINEQKKSDYNNIDIIFHDDDLVPQYRKIQKKTRESDGFYFSFSSGPRYIRNDNFFNIGFFPFYKNKNFTFSAKLDFYLNSDGKISKSNWYDKNNFLEKINFIYEFENYENSFQLYAGEIEKVSFGNGYLVNSISNSFDYPYNNFGIDLKYKLGNDFLNFRFIIPSIRDYFREGGVIGLHSSLFLSHRFPLTLGFGFFQDLNVFSQYRFIYDFPNDYENYKGLPSRNVKAAEFDFNFDFIKNMNYEVSLFGELVGIWYPENIHYARNNGTGSIGSVEVAERKGVWGMMTPGISVKLQNVHEIKFSNNYNSAGFYPSYFNTNYLYNRAVYFKIDQPLDFNNQNFMLLSEQIDMLNSFAINEELTEFMLPKEIYPMILNKFNPSPIRGFTIEYNYTFRNKADFSILFSRLTQTIPLLVNNAYYTLESDISIGDGYLKNISNLDFYFQNIFFIGDSDKQELVLGANIGLKITPVLSLIIDLSQVYYDSDLDGSMMKELDFLNFGLNIGASF